jgi:hypothetical protein
VLHKSKHHKSQPLVLKTVKVKMMGDRNKEMQQILEDLAKNNAPVDR